MNRLNSLKTYNSQYSKPMEKQKQVCSLPANKFIKGNYLSSLDALKNYNLSIISFGKRKSSIRKLKHSPIAFQGRGYTKVKTLAETELYKSYKNFVGNNKYNVIGFLKSTEAPPEEVNEFLIAVTSDKRALKNFINEVTRDMSQKDNPVNPRKSKEIVKTLVNKLGGSEAFKQWYFHPKGYFNAFTNHIKDFYAEAKSVQELIEFSPNWGSWKLRQKSKELGQNGFTLGILPSEFRSIDEFRNLVTQLRENNNKKQRLTTSISSFKKITKPGNSASGKFIIKLDDKYVLKTHYSSVKNNEYMDDIISHNADSAYLNGTVDYYTNFHNCTNSPKMLFYDYNTDSVLYENTKGKKIQVNDKQDNIFGNPKELNDKLSDLNSIGIFITDRGLGNYIEKDGQTIVIDIGHATYSDILKPGMIAYNVCLPNKTGFNPLEFKGMLDTIVY